MLQLRLFGHPAVTREDGSAGQATNQRKPLALLSLLAMAAERGESRDKLLAYLWPEISGSRGTHRLNQTLYVLRRGLQAEGLFLGMSRLRLNPALVACDVTAFLRAAAAGDLEAVVAGYGGAFLDGFHLRGAAEFDHWQEDQRSALARRYQEALEALAARAAAAGDPERAAGWLRRLADHDPASSRVTIDLMAALAASGRRADALKAARRYEQHLRTEYEAAPSPSVLALAEGLRSRQARASDGGSSARMIAVAVLPVASAASDPAAAALAASVTDELMQRLSREPEVRVIARTSVLGALEPGRDARALGERLGAGALIEGTLRTGGTRVRLIVTLVDTRDGCQAWSTTLESDLRDGFATEDALTDLVVTGLRPALDVLRSAAPGAGA